MCPSIPSQTSLELHLQHQKLTRITTNCLLASMKTLCLILLLFLFCSSSGRTEGIRDVVKLSNVHNQVDTRMKLRELTGVVSAMMLEDYRDPGSNPAHDPKGKPGGKGGNP